MRLVAALLVIELASGCVSTVGRRVGAVSVGSLAVGVTAGIVGASLPSDPGSHHSEAPGLGLDVLAVGLAVALVTGVIAIGAEMTSSTPVAIAPTRSGPASPCDPRAEQLTGEAQQAARLGQCSAVKSFGERVREIDPGCYAIELVAIRCGTP